jgi:predicted transcriptional regulator
MMQELYHLSPTEDVVLKLLEKGKLSPWELARKSPLGMRETQAIVEYLIRRGLITKKPADKTDFLELTERDRITVNSSV